MNPRAMVPLDRLCSEAPFSQCVAKALTGKRIPRDGRPFRSIRCNRDQVSVLTQVDLRVLVGPMATCLGAETTARELTVRWLQVVHENRVAEEQVQMESIWSLDLETETCVRGLLTVPDESSSKRIGRTSSGAP